MKTASFTLALLIIFSYATSSLAQSDMPSASAAKKEAEADVRPLVHVTVGLDEHFRGSLIAIGMASLVLEVEGVRREISLPAVSRIIFIRDWAKTAGPAAESGGTQSQARTEGRAAASGVRARGASAPPPPAAVRTVGRQAPAKSVVKPAAAGGGWFVILGSFPKTGRREADARLRRLRASGYDAHTIDTDDYPRLRGGLLAVVLGPYTREEAERAAGELRAKAAAGAYVKRGR